MPQQTARLLISCPDTRGIIAAVTGWVAKHHGNIIEADQHTDPDQNEFFMRIEIAMDGFDLDQATFNPAWAELADTYRMRWRVYWGNATKRMAVLVTQASHCLSDLLWRWRTGELPVDIPFVVGNRTALAETVEAFGIPFHHLPVTPETQARQEDRLQKLLADAGVEVVVLARYMRILSPSFVAAYPERIINIHHSFLPAFAGAKPYHQAYQRGVKLIGATSHYVTEDLDQGPIIAQHTTPVGHRDSIADLVRKGRDLERVVLATAVRLHLEDKILVSRNKTIVFD